MPRKSKIGLYSVSRESNYACSTDFDVSLVKAEVAKSLVWILLSSLINIIYPYYQNLENSHIYKVHISNPRPIIYCSDDAL